jgi:GntR family transcriptional repressor for pyruvate dehydrogenase complex
MPHRSSEVVAALEQEILEGTLNPGERLPSEEKLCARFNASRTVIREAIQQLRGRGMLRTLKGSGSYIANPSLDNLGSALETYTVLTPEDSFLELIDFRILIETECARLAAVHAGERGILGIQEALEEMKKASEDRSAFSHADITFHLAIAKASRNTLYATILRGLERRCIDYATINRGSGTWHDDVIVTHCGIFQAITDGDADAASAAMRRHLLLSRRHYVDIKAAS